MYIEELNGGDELEDELKKELCSGGGGILDWNTKRVLVGAGARALFYPTLLYNVVRNKIHSEFRWWDWIDEFVLLGAIPFRSDVKRLKVLGVGGVVTLNEPYETLVPSSLYHDYGISHLVLPTRDYLFAPSLNDISRAVEFIHNNALCGESTYIHCKAGRGRSTTIVICYLVKYKHMMPEAAYSYVKSIRPRVLLASSQWQAVQDFYQLQVKTTTYTLIPRSSMFLTRRNFLAFDDCSVVVITKEDLDGYAPNNEHVPGASDAIYTNFGLIYRVGGSALSKLSCYLLSCNNGVSAKQLKDLTVNFHVYA